MIADSHCHLDYDILYNELEDVITRASRNNVKLLLTICTTFESFKKIKFIVDKYSNIFGTFGIHPHESKNFININSDLIVKHKNEHKKIIGIGETGLDYHYNHSTKEIQKSYFSTNSIENVQCFVYSRNPQMRFSDRPIKGKNVSFIRLIEVL